MHRLDYITSLNSYLVSQQLTSKQTVLNGQLISQEEEAYKQQAKLLLHIYIYIAF
jgi:hypothetical protein